VWELFRRYPFDLVNPKTIWRIVKKKSNDENKKNDENEKKMMKLKEIKEGKWKKNRKELNW